LETKYATTEDKVRITTN